MLRLRKASSRSRVLTISYLNTVVSVKISGSGKKVIRVPVASLVPTSSRSLARTPYS